MTLNQIGCTYKDPNFNLGLYFPSVIDEQDGN